MTGICIACGEVAADGMVHCWECLQATEEVPGEALKRTKELEDIVAILNMSAGRRQRLRAIEGILSIEKKLRREDCAGGDEK